MLVCRKRPFTTHADRLRPRHRRAWAGLQRVRPNDKGRPGYDPADLLKLYIYGYLNRVRSSRRLEVETHRNSSSVFGLKAKGSGMWGGDGQPRRPVGPVRAHLPAPWQDILDLAYYSGWRKNEILGLTWDELDEAGGVIRLSPARSKTLVGRILPISQLIAEALARRRARRDPDSPLVFHRDGIPIRRWRTAWRTACQAAGVPTRFLHDCRRTAARNLIRASVPERVAMLLTGHKTRAIFDRYNIINEQELLEAGDQLVAYLAQHAQATPRRRAHPASPRTAPPLRLVRRTTA